MKKALVAVLALALTAGGFAAAGEKGMVIGAGYGNNTVTFKYLNQNESISMNAFELELCGYQAFGDSPVALMTDLGVALPNSFDDILATKTITYTNLGFSYAMNAVFGIQYNLSFGSPLSFGLGAGVAMNASSINSGRLSLIMLGVGGRASVKYAFSKNLGLVLGVREAYYLMPILTYVGSYDYSESFTSANNLSGSLGLAISY